VIAEHFAARLAEPIVVCGVRFDHADYDEAADYLYLTKGVSLGPADDDTCEGHTVFLGQNDRVICLLINGAKWHLERDAIEPLLVETIRY